MKRLVLLLLLSIMLVGFAQSCLAIECKLLISEDTALVDKWYNVPMNSGPTIAVTNQVYPKQYFTIFLLLNNYGVNKANEAKVNYDLEIIKSDGTVYYKGTDLEAVNSRVGNQSVLLLGMTRLKMCFELKDKYGDYTVKVKARDLVANKAALDEGKIQLIKFETKDYFKDDQTYGEWMTNYYQDPEAEKAISAYLYYAKSKLSEEETVFLPTLSFFLKIFDNNKWLLDHAVKLYGKQDEKTRVYLLYLLRFANHLPEEFTQTLNKKERGILNGLAKEKLPDPYGEIVSPEQIDMLWGEFYAGGEYGTIKRIVDLLELCKYKGSMEKYQKSKKTKADEEKAYLDVIYRSIRWSLTNNCSQHKLVYDYCNFIYSSEELPGDVKKELKEILGESIK